MANGTPQKKKTTTTTGGGGSFLTQRLGPLPVWVWVVVAVGVYLVFFRKKSTTQTTGTTTTTQPTETVTYPTGTSYSGPVGYAPTYGGGGGGGTSTGGGAAGTPGKKTTTPGKGGTTPGNGTNPVPVGGTIVTPVGANLFSSGSGESIERTGKLATGAVYGSTGSLYSTIQTYTQTEKLLQSGQTVYYQQSPGQFTPITTVTAFRSLEHTKQGKQTTTYVKG